MTVSVEDDEPPEQHTMERADWDTPVSIEPLELLLEEYRRPHQFQWSQGDELDEEEPWWMSLQAEDEPEQEARNGGKGSRSKSGDAVKKVTCVACGGPVSINCLPAPDKRPNESRPEEVTALTRHTAHKHTLAT